MRKHVCVCQWAMLLGWAKERGQRRERGPHGHLGGPAVALWAVAVMVGVVVAVRGGRGGQSWLGIAAWDKEQDGDSPSCPCCPPVAPTTFAFPPTGTPPQPHLGQVPTNKRSAWRLGALRGRCASPLQRLQPPIHIHPTQSKTKHDRPQDLRGPLDVQGDHHHGPHCREPRGDPVQCFCQHGRGGLHQRGRRRKRRGRRRRRRGRRRQHGDGLGAVRRADEGVGAHGPRGR